MNTCHATKSPPANCAGKRVWNNLGTGSTLYVNKHGVLCNGCFDHGYNGRCYRRTVLENGYPLLTTSVQCEPGGTARTG